MATCSIQDCEKPAANKGLCWMHIKRLQRLHSGKGKRGLNDPAQPKASTLLERVRTLVARFSELDTDELADEEHRRLDELLRKALIRARKVSTPRRTI